MRVVRLSTRGHYGLKAMFDLAWHHGEGPIPLKSVAERQHISEPYLEQLIAVLRRAALVKSVRGAQGGYVLARPPAEIRAGDVIRALEGPLAPLQCVDENHVARCDEADYCISRMVWVKVRDALAGVLASLSLADMCREAQKTVAAEADEGDGDRVSDRAAGKR